jgi:hypothetical protein
MPLQIQLVGTGPGRGLFEISGLETGADALELAIQRNRDERYLGPDLSWQTSAHWHWCPRVDTDGKVLRLAAGPDIVDGVLGSAVNALRVELGGEERRLSAVLRMRGLVGSPAGADRRRAGLAPLSVPDAGEQAAMRTAPAPLPGRRPVWLLATLLGAGAALAALSLAWHGGLFDSERLERTATAGQAARPDGVAAPAADAGGGATGEAGRADTPKARSGPEPAPGGRAFVQGYLAHHPTPRALYETALARASTGDCEAAVLLLERAASADAGIAGRVAALYDPDGFRASPCIESPDRSSALIWYEDAAKAGHRFSQRRLGRLLTEQHPSGLLHEEGLHWLRRAAAQGDQEARRIIDRLEGL